jgi:hypothetical protein
MISSPSSKKRVIDADDFVKRARGVHADTYDYPNVSYVNASTKVSIQCKKHGEFLQKPASHLAGQGCTRCAIDRRRMSMSYYIKQFREIHGYRYDYSKSEYAKNRHDKTTIACAIHGDFLQSIIEHLRGHGCPLCGYPKRLTTEEFISKSKSVHGDEYDYSETAYVSHNIKVDIVCRRHGLFKQTASDHVSGRGCAACRGGVKWTTEAFITRAKEVHGDTYDYSKTVYTSSKAKVDVVCRQHGVFSQYVSNHIGGHGCARCARMKTRRGEIFSE